MIGAGVSGERRLILSAALRRLPRSASFRLFLHLLLLVAAFGAATVARARAPDEAFSIPWDAPREQAPELVAKGQRARFVAKLSSDTLLYFVGGVWEDWRLQHLQVSYADGRLARATAYFADRDGDPPDFDTVVSVLTEEYGEPVAKGTTQAAWRWPAAAGAATTIELTLAPAGLKLTFARGPADAS